MTITLYSFTKKNNSTARPGPLVSKKVFNNAYLKNASSLITPMIQLAKDNDPTGCNYCYVSEWKRYYFITDIVYALGVWQLSLRVDVLASFRSDIFSSSQYVLRSASAADGNILDMIYTTKATDSSNYSETSASSTVTLPDEQGVIANYFSGDYTTGVFVLGIVSNNNTGVSYYSMSYADFGTFMTQLMTTVPNDMTDVSAGVAKSLYDPIQYVTTCKWYPFDPAVGITPVVSDIKIGGYTVSGLNAGRLNGSRKKHFSDSITIPLHPQAATRPYVKLSPFSEYNLLFEPFGNIPIDSTKIYGTSKIDLDWYLDTVTGDSELFITNHSTGSLLANVTANIAVDVQISQLTVDYMGMASGYMTAVGGMFGGMLTGDIASAINSTVSGIGNILTSKIPQLSTKGVSGSFLSYSLGVPKLCCYFTSQVDTDNLRYGSPLCQVKTLSTLSGFCMTSNATIEIDGLVAENEEICSLLNSGVYLE